MELITLAENPAFASLMHPLDKNKGFPDKGLHVRSPTGEACFFAYEKSCVNGYRIYVAHWWKKGYINILKYVKIAFSQLKQGDVVLGPIDASNRKSIIWSLRAGFKIVDSDKKWVIVKYKVK